MEQLTIRGFDAELFRRLKMLADEEGLSLNQAALRLMRRGAGLEPPERAFKIGDAIRKYSGIWSDQEAGEFEQALQACEQIDWDMW